MSFDLDAIDPIVANYRSIMGKNQHLNNDDVDLLEPDLDSELQRQEREEPRSRVLLHNDDVTPYDFVVATLLRFFPLSSADAEQVTWIAHTSGTSLVAILPHSDAQRRVSRARFAANLEGFPLSFSIEPE